MDDLTYAPLRWSGERWERWAAPGPEARRELKIVTWNVWFGELMFKERRAALLAELARRDADVIALQEVTSPLLSAIHAAPWIRAGYQVSELDVSGYDVVLLARAPVRHLVSAPLPTTMGRRLLVARLACGLDVATVHLESMSISAEERATQLRIIQPLLARRGEEAVLVGDMNFAPDAPLENAVLDPSFVDVWPALRPTDPGYTADSLQNPMRANERRRSVQKRIDRVFARTQRWRAASIELLGTAPIGPGTFISDHFGLEVVLTRAPERDPADPA